MTDVRVLFPGKYLKADDLRDRRGNYTDVTLTISRVVERETFKTDRGDDIGVMVYFAELEERHRRDPRTYPENKRLICNKTNATTIAKLYDRWDAQDWPGLRITLFKTTCQAFGEIKDCIRIRDVAPPPKRTKRKQAEQAPPDDDLPEDFGTDREDDPASRGELTEEQERELLGDGN